MFLLSAAALQAALLAGQTMRQMEPGGGANIAVQDDWAQRISQGEG